MSPQRLPVAMPVNDFGAVRIHPKPEHIEVSHERQFKFTFDFGDENEFLTFDYSGNVGLYSSSEHPDLLEQIQRWLSDYGLHRHLLWPIRNFVESVLYGISTPRHLITIPGIDGTGVFEIPPVQFRRKEAQPPTRSCDFTFAFIIQDDRAPLRFTCSNRDDIPDQVRKWTEHHEVPEFFQPVRNFVEHIIDGVSANPRWDVLFLSRDYLQIEQRTLLPFLGPTWRSQCLLKTGHSYTLNTFSLTTSSPHPPACASTVMMQLSPVRFEDFDNHHFHENILNAAFIEFSTKIPLRAATITLTTCAQILPCQRHDCSCHNDDSEDLGLQLATLTRLSEIIPSSENSTPQLLHDRMRYLFELLRCFLQTMNQSEEQVIRALEEEQQAHRAVKCILRALDATSRNHSDAVGSWAWECLLLPLSRQEVSRAGQGTESLQSNSAISNAPRAFEDTACQKKRKVSQMTNEF